MAAKTLTIHLAKEGANEFDDLLSQEARRRLNHPSSRIVDRDDFGDGARLYVFVGAFNSPKWLIELRRHFVAGPINSAALPSWGVGAKNSLARDGPVMPGAKIVNLKGPYPSAGRAQIHKSKAGLRGQTQST